MNNYCNFEIIASPICDVDNSFFPLEIISFVRKPSSKTSWTAFSKTLASLSKLREYLKNQAVSVSKVAKILDVPEVTVNSWKYGNKIPSKKNMDKIVEFTNKEVQPNDFYTWVFKQYLGLQSKRQIVMVVNYCWLCYVIMPIRITDAILVWHI